MHIKNALRRCLSNFRVAATKLQDSSLRYVYDFPVVVIRLKPLHVLQANMQRATRTLHLKFNSTMGKERNHRNGYIEFTSLSIRFPLVYMH